MPFRKSDGRMKQHETTTINIFWVFIFLSRESTFVCSMFDVLLGRQQYHFFATWQSEPTSSPLQQLKKTRSLFIISMTTEEIRNIKTHRKYFHGKSVLFTMSSSYYNWKSYLWPFSSDRNTYNSMHGYTAFLKYWVYVIFPVSFISHVLLLSLLCIWSKILHMDNRFILKGSIHILDFSCLDRRTLTFVFPSNRNSLTSLL